MKTSLKISAGFTAVFALACAGATAAAMTKDEYKAKQKAIAAEYQAERQKCGARYGNSLDLCVARTHGMRDVAKAELEAAYKPSPANNYKAAVARARSKRARARRERDAEKGAMKKKR